jgi:hypothetical protein
MALGMALLLAWPWNCALASEQADAPEHAAAPAARETGWKRPPVTPLQIYKDHASFSEDYNETDDGDSGWLISPVLDFTHWPAWDVKALESALPEPVQTALTIQWFQELHRYRC